MAEAAVETGTAKEVLDFLSDELKAQLRRRLDEVNRLAAGKDLSVQDARRYVEAMLGCEVHCHRLFRLCRHRHTTGTVALKVHLSRSVGATALGCPSAKNFSQAPKRALH
jgi:hypothetical protein